MAKTTYQAILVDGKSGVISGAKVLSDDGIGLSPVDRPLSASDAIVAIQGSTMVLFDQVNTDPRQLRMWASMNVRSGEKIAICTFSPLTLANYIQPRDVDAEEAIWNDIPKIELDLPTIL
jgi:hypothetical protein